MLTFFKPYSSWLSAERLTPAAPVPVPSSAERPKPAAPVPGPSSAERLTPETSVPCPSSAERLTPAATVPGPSSAVRPMLAGPLPVARAPMRRRPPARPLERHCPRRRPPARPPESLSGWAGFLSWSVGSRSLAWIWWWVYVEVKGLGEHLTSTTDINPHRWEHLADWSSRLKGSNWAASGETQTQELRHTEARRTETLSCHYCILRHLQH